MLRQEDRIVKLRTPTKMKTLITNGKNFYALWCHKTSALRGIVLMCISTVAFASMEGLLRFVSDVLHALRGVRRNADVL